MDKIIIQGLQVKSLIGVYDWERNAKQALEVDVELAVDLTAAANSDNVQDTIDYAALAASIEELCYESEFALLEALANKLIQHLLGYVGVQSVTLAISKPNILANARAVTVKMYREAT
jgi:dihydroneopterin aldolase